MASTLVRRLARPSLADGDVKLAILIGRCVFQEVIASRLPREALLAWLAESEYKDANVILDKIHVGVYTLEEAFCWCTLAEREIYTVQQVEALLQLPPSEAPPA